MPKGEQKQGGVKPPTTHRFSEMSNFAQSPNGQRRKLILIDTPSQGVRSSIQLAEADPGVLASLRNMWGERKFRAITCNPTRRIAEAAAARRGSRSYRNHNHRI
jgi:hypothetical protein